MKKGFLFIFFATILFSTMEIALKLSASQFNPIQSTFLRFFIGSFVLLPFALKNKKKRKLSFNRGDIKFFMLQGFICVVISMILFQLGIINGKASNAAVLFSCNPVFVIPFAAIILKEKITKYTIITLVVSVLGMMLITNPANLQGSMNGVIYSLSAALVFALYGVIGKTRSVRYGGLLQTCFSFLAGSVEMLIVILISKIPFVSDWCSSSGLEIFASVPILQGITIQNAPWLVYLGVGVTGLGYTFYNLAIEYTSATTGSLVFYIKPALAPVLALIILSESIIPTSIIGIILILIGSAVTFISNIRKQPKELRPEKLKS